MNDTTDRRDLMLKALEALDDWCDRAGAPMSVREQLQRPWKDMLDEIGDGFGGAPTKGSTR
jgi:hypothetical protein